MDPLLYEEDRQLEAELIHAGKDVQLSAASQARLLAALGVSAGAAATAKAAASTGILSKLLGGKGGAIALASVVSVGAVGTGVYLADSAAPANFDISTPAAVVTGSPLPVAPSEQAPVSKSAAQAAMPTNPKASAPDTSPTPDAKAGRVKQVTGGERATAQPRSQPNAKAGLGDELALLESASRATKSGNPALALQRLNEYQRQFSRGKLALEARVLRIEALAQAGQRAEAQRLARAFLKRHPKSPVAARIRRFAE